MKYFYIIKRNGQIYEMAYSEAAYQATFEEFIKGGILLARPAGYTNPQAINAKDITDVLDEQGYKAYISTAKPKEFVSAGVWYDGKFKKEVRVEPWKQKERDSRKQVTAPEEKPITPAMQKRIDIKKEEIRAILNKNK